MKIDKFQNFLDSLVESYNTPVEIKWIERGNLIGLFCVDDKVYQINCVDRGNDIWTYKFYLYDNASGDLLTNLTNFKTGKMSVLSTIRNGMKYLVKNKSPKCLIFGALDKSEGRKKLYYAFSEELEKEFGYKLNTAKFSNKQIFVLFKPDIDKNLIEVVIKDLIQEIVDEL